MSFNGIAEWLNDNNYRTVRGKTFKSAHVHSIIRKRRIRDAKLEKEYPKKKTPIPLLFRHFGHGI